MHLTAPKLIPLAKKITNSLDAETRALDLLALAAENEILKKQVAQLVLENENHIRKDKSKTLDDKMSQPVFMSTKRLRENTQKDEFVYYTGLNGQQFTAF